MGPAGAAVGTLASTVVSFVFLLIFLLKDKTSVKLKVRKMFDFSGGFAGKYFKKCLPVIANEFLYGVGQMLINMVIGRQPESAIAAMAAYRVLEGFVFAFFGGLADASSVVVGREVGGGRPMNGYRYMKGFAILCPMITFTIMAIFLCINQPLLGLFGLGPEAMEYGKYMILIFMFAGAIRTCNYIMNIGFRAGGEAVFGTVVEIGALFTISVPMTALAGMVWHLPFLAVFAFVYTDELLRFVIEIFYARSCRWVKPVTPQGVEAMPGFRQELQTLRKRK
jgi:Na+-driven multidrug efflux pump